MPGPASGRRARAQIYDPGRSLLTKSISSQTVECKTRPGPEEEARVGGGAERSRNPKWPGATAPGLRVARWGPGWRANLWHHIPGFVSGFGLPLAG